MTMTLLRRLWAGFRALWRDDGPVSPAAAIPPPGEIGDAAPASRERRVTLPSWPTLALCGDDCETRVGATSCEPWNVFLPGSWVVAAAADDPPLPATGSVDWVAARPVETPVRAAALRHADLVSLARRRGGIRIVYSADGEPSDGGPCGRTGVVRVEGFPSWRLAHVDDLHLSGLWGECVATSTLERVPLHRPRAAFRPRARDGFLTVVDTASLCLQ